MLYKLSLKTSQEETNYFPISLFVEKKAQGRNFQKQSFQKTKPGKNIKHIKAITHLVNTGMAVSNIA